MHQDKIEAALSKALTDLHEAINTLATSGSDEKILADVIWTASAETEYAVFLLNLIKRGTTESPRSEKSPTKQPIELPAVLADARELLQDARARIEKRSFERAYETTWSARKLLLKAQEQLEKKRQETGR